MSSLGYLDKVVREEYFHRMLTYLCLVMIQQDQHNLFSNPEKQSSFS